MQTSQRTSNAELLHWRVKVLLSPSTYVVRRVPDKITGKSCDCRTTVLRFISRRRTENCIARRRRKVLNLFKKILVSQQHSVEVAIARRSYNCLATVTQRSCDVCTILFHFLAFKIGSRATVARLLYSFWKHLSVLQLSCDLRRASVVRPSHDVIFVIRDLEQQRAAILAVLFRARYLKNQRRRRRWW